MTKMKATVFHLVDGVTGYAIGNRVLVGAITPCGQCRACLSGQLSQCGHGEAMKQSADGALATQSIEPKQNTFVCPARK